MADSPEFTEFTAILHRLTGLVMALKSASGTIRRTISETEWNPICRLIRSNSVGLRRCLACNLRHDSLAAKSGTTQLYACHVGFRDIAVPIFASGRHVATIFSGQVLAEPKSPAAFRRLRKRLAWLKVPEHDLRAAYDHAIYLPRKQFASVMRLLELFARQLCESAQRIRDLEAKLERVEVRRGREFVESRFRDASLCLNDAARHACLAPTHFSHVFRQTTGTSFTRFVQARRVAEAKKQLMDTRKSITDICFACGFNSLTHFNRVFRAFEHCSPRQYRESHVLQHPA
jgi:AraC-like DNA-binding protein